VTFAQCFAASNSMNPLSRLWRKLRRKVKVKAYTFCLYTLHIQLASIVENGETVQVGYGAVRLVQVHLASEDASTVGGGSSVLSSH
jgi:hypothetical protein